MGGVGGGGSAGICIAGGGGGGRVRGKCCYKRRPAPPGRGVRPGARTFGLAGGDGGAQPRPEEGLSGLGRGAVGGNGRGAGRGGPSPSSCDLGGGFCLPRAKGTRLSRGLPGPRGRRAADGGQRGLARPAAGVPRSRRRGGRWVSALPCPGPCGAARRLGPAAHCMQAATLLAIFN